jgi:hypothetical protein
MSSFISCIAVGSAGPFRRVCLEELAGLRPRLDRGLAAIVLSRERRRDVEQEQLLAYKYATETRRSINKDAIKSCTYQKW